MRIVLILLLITGPALADTSPDGAKKAILANKSRMFKDPDSVRDAAMGRVGPCPSGYGDCVCLKLNARNSQGGMTGPQTIGVRLRDGSAEAFGQMADTSDCGKMTPFPALNGKR